MRRHACRSSFQLQIPLTAICRRVAPRATVTVGGKPDSIYQAQSFGSTISHSGESFAYGGFWGAGAVALCMLQINYIPGSWELSPWFFAIRLPRIFAISQAKQFAFNANMNKSVLIAKLGQQLFWSGLYLSY